MRARIEQVVEEERKSKSGLVIFHRVNERNSWEGETWYHYFLDQPEVLDTLKHLVDDPDNDLSSVTTLALTWDTAEKLTNEDCGTYMQCHWFGELTRAADLKNTKGQDLYKGAIRDFGEELFSYDNREEET